MRVEKLKFNSPKNSLKTEVSDFTRNLWKDEHTFQILFFKQMFFYILLMPIFSLFLKFEIREVRQKFSSKN